MDGSGFKSVQKGKTKKVETSVQTSAMHGFLVSYTKNAVVMNTS
jgi:hypothetical protein